MDDNLMSVKQAAEYLKVSERSIRNYARDKRVKHMRISDRVLLFQKEWLDEFVQNSIIAPNIKQEVKENE